MLLNDLKSAEIFRLADKLGYNRRALEHIARGRMPGNIKLRILLRLATNNVVTLPVPGKLPDVVYEDEIRAAGIYDDRKTEDKPAA